MRIKTLLSILISIIIFSCNTGIAKDVTYDSVTQLMTLSGLDKQINDLPESIIELIQQYRKETSYSSSENVNIKHAIIASFDPSVILSNIRKKIKSDISQEEASFLLKWYKSEMGILITEAEVKSSSPDAIDKIIHNSNQLLANGKTKKIAIRIDRLVGSTDLAMRLQKYSLIATLSSIRKSLNYDNELNIDEIKNQVANNEQQARGNIQQMIILSYIYCYKDVDIKNIEEYIQFLEHPVTKKFHASVINAIENSMNSSIDKLLKLYNSSAKSV